MTIVAAPNHIVKFLKTEFRAWDLAKNAASLQLPFDRPETRLHPSERKEVE